MSANRFQIKRGSTASVAAYSPLAGELVWDVTLNQLYVGGVKIGSPVGAVGAQSMAAGTQAAGRSAIGAISASDSITGNASTADKLSTARTISLTGDVTGSVTFDGSADSSATTTLAPTGVPAGTYTRVTVDTKGRVTAGQSSALAVANGGTGATTVATARAALSAAASGANSDITSLTGLTTALSIAQGGTGSNTAATARTALGVSFTSWVNLTLSNSWTTISGRRSTYRSFLDLIQVEVNITGGTSTDATVVSTLPVGFRPAFPVVIPVASGSNTTISSTVPVPRVLIGTDGTIACYNCTNAPGISFTAVFSNT